MTELNTIDSTLFSSGLRQVKNGGSKKENKFGEGFMSRVSGVQDTAEIASDLRQGKIGVAAMGAAEKGVDAAITLYTGGIGKIALKAGDFLGIPVSRIIIYSVLGFFLFLFLPIIGFGAYAFAHPISTACKIAFGIDSFVCNL